MYGFPHPQRGDKKLHSQEINNLSTAVELGQWKTSYQNGRNGAGSQYPPFVQVPLIVTSLTDGEPYTPKVKPRYWNSTDSEWATKSDNNEVTVDSSIQEYQLLVDEQVLGWWEPLRQAFIFSGGGKAKKIRFSLTATLATTDEYATVNILNYWDGHSPVAEGVTQLLIYNLPISSNYLFSGSTGAVGLAYYDTKQAKYFIYQMECP